MNPISNFVIAGDSRTGKTTYATSLVEDGNYIKINTAGSPIYEILANLTSSLVGTKPEQHDMTLIVDELNYGSYGTKDLIRIIREINNVVAKVNANRDEPLIRTVIWIGTRATLIKLVVDELTYSLMKDDTDVQIVKVSSVNKVNEEPLADYFADEEKPFKVYTIDINAD